MIVNGLTEEQTKLEGVIYKINFPNGKCYVGLTNRKLEDRVLDHKERVKHGKQLICKAFKKYGFENAIWEILEFNKSKEELYDLEILYISKFNSSNRDFGYNMTDGGEGRFNSKHTEESLAKISGSNNHGAILDEEKVEYIKIKLLEGVGATKLAKEFGIYRCVIKNIKLGKNWKQVRPDLNDKMKIRDSDKVKKYVVEIKNMMVEGYSNHEISERFGIIRQNITAIRRLSHYADVCPELNEAIKNTQHIQVPDLSEDMVVKIKKLLINGLTNIQVCEELNLGKINNTVGLIKRLKTYKQYGSEYNDELRRLYGKQATPDLHG